QSIIAVSSTEADYFSLSHATQEIVWLRQLLNNIGFKQTKPTKLYEDNQGAIGLSKNPKLNSRTKHIDIKFHYVREAVETNIVNVKYCLTENMTADIFTKSLARVKFEKFRDMLGVKK
ncbi:MAG: Ty1/Copia family ribonuclease HI, partial [Cyanobacteria bacterium J06649_11]